MTPPLRVGLIGWGAIGRPVGRALLTGEFAGADLVGVATRNKADDLPVARLDVADLAEAADVVVEVAGQSAVVDHGPTIVEAGCDVLISSVGALANPDLRSALSAGPGRHLITTGAVGGLDLLAAATRLGRFESATLTTTKAAASLIQPWMDQTLTARLEAGEGDVVCFDGPVDEAARKFPASINVAAALALAVDDWDLPRVVIRSAATGAPNRHLIETTGPAGHHRFELTNRPSPDNPKTSAIVSAAVLRSLALLCPRTGTIL